MIRRIKRFIEMRSGIPVKDQVKDLYGVLRNRFWMNGADPDAYLSAYRQLALQLSRNRPDRGSVLVATPAKSASVAQCCALLATNMASILGKPTLLVDLSDEGRRMPNLLGLTSEMYCSTDERSRYFAVSGRWYVSTREGIPIGPYRSVDDAEAGLSEFVDAPSWVKDIKAQEFSPQRIILPTRFQNLFFLPPEPARQALVRSAHLGKQAESLAALFHDLYERFSHVVFYGGSIIDNPLMLSVVPHVDEVLHAVVENDTRISDLRGAQETLQTYRTDQIPFILIRPSRRSAGAKLAS